MASLEYSSDITRRQVRTYGSVHHCNICHYFTKSIFFMRNHVRRHVDPPDPFDCERSTVEVFYCKECNFKTSHTSFFNHHIKLRHNRNATNEPIQPTKFLLTSYKCDPCSFQTYSVMLWWKHRTNCMERHYGRKECENLSDKITWEEKYTGKEEREAKYEKDENRSADNVRELPQALEGSDVKKFKCDECPYATKKKAHLCRHKLIHLPRSCTKCSYTTKNTKDLRLHRKIHLPEVLKRNKSNVDRWLQCDKCSYKTISKRSLEVHHFSKHPRLRSKSFQCPHCAIKTSDQHLLDTHIRDSHKKVPVKSKCIYKTVSKRPVEVQNISKHPKLRSKIFKCPHCPIKTSGQHLLDTHMRYRHNVVPVKSKCIDKTISKRSLKVHPISEHPKLRSKRFKCPHCPIKTSGQHLLDAHMRDRHNIVPVKSENLASKIFQCPHCPITTNGQHRLDTHIRYRHTKVTVKSENCNDQTSKNGFIRCSHCYFKTTGQDLMNKHLLRRHKEFVIKPKTATKINNRRVARNNNTVNNLLTRIKDNFPVAAKNVLNEHIQDVRNPRVAKDIATVKLLTSIKDNLRVASAEHSAKPYAVACVAPEVAKKEKVEAFKCKKCQFQTDSTDALIEHNKSEHVVYRCGGCDYNTKKRIDLMIHVKLTHSGHPLKCDVCPRQYATKPSLIRHMKESHTSEDEIEWFSCLKCPYKAKRRGHLMAHLRVRNH